MIENRTVGTRLFQLVIGLVLTALCISWIYPLWHVFAVSISGPSAVQRNAVNILPLDIDFRMYQIILSLPQVQRGYLNTVLYAAGGTLIALVSNSFYAYPLSKPDLPGRRFFVIYLAITMFFSGGLIPTWLVIRSLGMLNTYLVMVLPAAVGAWTVIVMRTFFQSLPYSYTESAMIDGASEIQILARIIVPLSKPLYATMGLFTIVGIWNSWFNALIYLDDPRRWPIQMTLREITIRNVIPQSAGMQQYMEAMGRGAPIPLNYQYTMLMVVIIPILIMYPFLQKYFVKGVMVGSIKG